MSIIRLTLLFLLIIEFSLATSILLKKTFAKCIPLSFLFFYFIQYGAHLFGKLSYFKYLLFVCVIAFAVIIFKHKNCIKDLLKNNSFYVFSFIFVFIFLLTGTKGFSCIDDFHYWGIKVKECLRLDALYSVSNTVIAPDTYHPFCTIIEIFFCKVLGGYSEQYCLFASSLFSFSFFLCTLNNKLRNNILAIVFGTIISLSISISGVALLFNSLYVDWPLAIVLGYSIYCVYDFDYSLFSYIYLSCILTILLLIKQPAIIYYFALIGFLLILHFYDNKRKKFLYILFIPFIIYLVWRINVSYYIFESNIKPITDKSFLIIFSNITSGIANDFWKTIWNVYIKACFNKKIVGSFIKVSYVVVISIIFIVFIIISILKKDKKIRFVSYFYLFGSILYLFGMYISYCTSFNEYEALTLAAFPRYMQVYSFSGFVILFYLILEKCNISIIISWMMVSLLFVEPKSFKTINPALTTISYRNVNQNEVYEYVNAYVGDDKVLCIAETDWTEYEFVKYLFFDKMNSLTRFDKQNISNKVSFKDYINNFQYIYVGIFDDEFKNVYWDSITDIEIYNESLYAIKNNDEKGIFIELVHSFEN